jgi:hypothetical protein
MARYLHRCSDGAPLFYVDEDVGDPMIYSLHREWIGYISDDRKSVHAPDGRLLWTIDAGYLYDGRQAVLYFSQEAEDTFEIDALSDHQRTIIDRFTELLANDKARQAYRHRLIELLEDELFPDDAELERLCEQAMQET